MQRSDPLQELPLERFLPSNLNIQPAAAKPIRSNKRPLSPGGPFLFSPAKRRILNDEGIYSPEKTYKSPLPSLVTSLEPPARFSRILSSPASPARVLDFGLPKDLHGDPQKRTYSNVSVVEITPVQISSSSNHLAPSPELKARRARPTQTSPLPDYSELECDGHGCEDKLSPLSSATSNVPQFTPRELPPQPDPHSIHYPGFYVFQDPYLAVFRTTAAEVALVSNIENDTQKENLPPRRKARKVALNPKADPDVFSVATITPRKSQSTNQTSKRMEPWGSAELSSTIASNMFRISSPSTTVRQGRKSQLQMMKDEMDIVDEDQNSGDE